MLTEEMMRAAVQERNHEIANFEREARWHNFVKEADAALAEAPRQRPSWRTFLPSISIAGIRQLVGARGRA